MSSPDNSWRGRPVAAASLRVLTWVLPIGASVVASALLSRVIPRPSGLFELIGWWLGIGAVSVAVLLVVDRAARRLLPLAALLRLTLVFPDHAPPRYRAAYLGTSIGQLRGEVARLSSKAESGELALGEANEFAITMLQLAARLDAHDPLTHGHSDRVRAYSRVLGDELGLSEHDLERLQWAGFLHDIGKLEVPRELISKPGPLELGEQTRVRTHPEAGSKLVAPMASWLGDWSLAVGEHHEHWDGTGYPAGIAGAEISLAARIVAVADAFDVITSTRSYKQALSPEFARAEIATHAGTQFDPVVVRALLSVSLGRLRWIMGPLSWLAQIPVLASVSAAPVAATVTSAVVAVSVAGATGALASEAYWNGPELEVPAVVLPVEAAIDAGFSLVTATVDARVPATATAISPTPVVTATAVPTAIPTVAPTAISTAVPTAAATATSTVAPTATTTAVPMTPTASPVPTVAAVPADGTWVIAAEEGAYSYPAAAAGMVTFGFDDGDLTVLDVGANGDWSASILEDSGSELLVVFSSEDWRVSFAVDRQDSTLVITVRTREED